MNRPGPVESGQRRIVLTEHMSFLNQASMIRQLQEVPAVRTVIIDGSRCKMADHEVSEVIKDFVQCAPGRGVEVQLENLDEVEIFGVRNP